MHKVDLIIMTETGRLVRYQPKCCLGKGYLTVVDRLDWDMDEWDSWEIRADDDSIACSIQLTSKEICERRLLAR